MADIDEMIGKASDGARIANAMPYIEHEIGKMEKAVETRARVLSTANELTPELALQLWYEKLACQNLVKRLDTLVRVGQGGGSTT